MKNKHIKNIFYWILIIVILFSFSSCSKNAKDTTKSQDIKSSNTEIQLEVASRNSLSAVMTVSGIEFPESFKAKYDGYSEGKVPYYCTITFGDYSVNLLYIASLIDEYAKSEGETEIPLSALKANVMKITGSGDNARSDEIQDCIVNVWAEKNSLTFDFEMSSDCDVDLTKISDYNVEVFALGDFQTKTFHIKQGSISNSIQENPTKRDLKVTLIDERTAQFRLTDPELEDSYQVAENLTYNWEINFLNSKMPENKGKIYSMTPYVNSLTSVSNEKLSCGFIINGHSVGNIENGENQSETQLDFEIDGKTMVWTVHYPEFFRLGEEYDKTQFDFRDFDTFTVQHFSIENNTANTIYDEHYSPEHIIYDNDFIENYNIKPVPELFYTNSDGEYFKPISSDYVIVETVIEVYSGVVVKAFSLYSLNEMGIVIDECHKWKCSSTKDFRFLIYGENDVVEPLGIQIDKNVVNTSGEMIYFKENNSSIGYPLEDVLSFRDKCNEDGYYRQTDYKENEERLIYFSKTGK